MKKGLLIIFVLIFACAAHASKDDNQSPNVLGLGIFTAASPYKDVDTQTLPIPIASLRNDKFFIEGLEAGYIVAEGDNFRVDFFVAPRLMGYDADDGASLNGMENRKYSLDGGMRLKLNIPSLDNFYIKTTVASDLLSENDGQEISLSLCKDYKHDYFLITPSIGIKWQSENMVDYYYGVKTIEARTGRNAYFPNAATNYFFNLNLNLGLSKDWILVGIIDFEKLNSEINDSPIVDDDYIVWGVLGIARMF